MKGTKSGNQGPGSSPVRCSRPDDHPANPPGRLTRWGREKVWDFPSFSMATNPQSRLTRYGQYLAYCACRVPAALSGSDDTVPAELSSLAGGGPGGQRPTPVGPYHARTCHSHRSPGGDGLLLQCRLSVVRGGLPDGASEAPTYLLALSGVRRSQRRERTHGRYRACRA